jgi:hypothetical protein
VVGLPGPLGVPAGERLGPLRVPGLDGLDHLRVLGPRPVTAGGGHHPVVPLHPAADDVGQFGQHRVAADGRDLGVEGVVGRHGGAEVIRVGGRLPLAADLPQPGQPGGPARVRPAGPVGPAGRAGRRQPARLGLEQRPHVQQFVHFGVGGHVHEGALAGPQVHPPLGLHAVQRLADRLPADAELAGQVSLDHVLARRQLPAHDQVDQRVIHRLAQRHRPLQRADHR